MKFIFTPFFFWSHETGYVKINNEYTGCMKMSRPPMAKAPECLPCLSCPGAEFADAEDYCQVYHRGQKRHFLRVAPLTCTGATE